MKYLTSILFLQTLFEQVRNHGYSIEHWPSWLSRTLSNASSTLDPEDED